MKDIFLLRLWDDLLSNHNLLPSACQYFGPAEDHLSLVRLLVETGCDLNAADRQGWTPLYQSAFGGDTGGSGLKYRKVKLNLIYRI